MIRGGLLHFQPKRGFAALCWARGGFALVGWRVPFRSGAPFRGFEGQTRMALESGSTITFLHSAERSPRLVPHQPPLPHLGVHPASSRRPVFPSRPPFFIFRYRVTGVFHGAMILSPRMNRRTNIVASSRRFVVPVCGWRRLAWPKPLEGARPRQAERSRHHSRDPRDLPAGHRPPSPVHPGPPTGLTSDPYPGNPQEALEFAAIRGCSRLFARRWTQKIENRCHVGVPTLALPTARTLRIKPNKAIYRFLSLSKGSQGGWGGPAQPPSCPLSPQSRAWRALAAGSWRTPARGLRTAGAPVRLGPEPA